MENCVSEPFSEVTAPNQLWCMDFKGYFSTGDGTRCDPFTITDAHSRYLIRCQIVSGMDLSLLGLSKLSLGWAYSSDDRYWNRQKTGSDSLQLRQQAHFSRQISMSSIVIIVGHSRPVGRGRPRHPLSLSH
jgi:transposase InsO family protein